MPKKPRIPDPASVTKCPDCGKSKGGKGYYGPGCMCHLPPPKEWDGKPVGPWG
jgi:hypothetical protein